MPVTHIAGKSRQRPIQDWWLFYFMKPDNAGNFHTNFEPICKFIDAAHRKGVNVLTSIGGGGRNLYYHELLKDVHRAKLVKGPG